MIPYEAYWRVDHSRIPVTVLTAPIRGEVEVIRPRIGFGLSGGPSTIDVPIEDIVGLDSDSSAVTCVRSEVGAMRTETLLIFAGIILCLSLLIRAGVEFERVVGPLAMVSR